MMFRNEYEVNLHSTHFLIFNEYKNKTFLNKMLKNCRTKGSILKKKFDIKNIVRMRCHGVFKISPDEEIQ